MPRSLPSQTPAFTRVTYLLACAALCCLTRAASTARAADGDVVYQGAPARITANVENWGKDCGVRPKSYTLNERPQVTVTRKGDDLVLRFPSGTVHSNRCWSRNPALQLVSTSARVGSWKTRCETPPGDPKSETGVYEIVARDEQTLELTESSRYDWQLKSSHCIATVRTVRVLTRLTPPDEGEEPIEVAEEPASGDTPQEPDCVPGSLDSLRVVPHKARVEPGQRICFSARGKDADGCVIKNPHVSWSVKALEHGKGQMHGNCFRSASSAAEGEGRFRIVASTGRLHARAALQVATPDLSDITLHALPGSSLTPPPSAEPVDDPGIRSKTRVAARALQGPHRGVWLAALAGLLVMAAGGATWLATRRRGAALAAQAAAQSSPGREASPPPAAPREPVPPAAAVASPKPAPRPTEPMICPKCRRGYAPGAERCETDGTALITYKAFTSQAATSEVTCPACGATFSDGTTFCGKCGARLSS